MLQFDKSTAEPSEYDDAENPPYSYYLYYMYANLTALNAFRRSVLVCKVQMRSFFELTMKSLAFLSVFALLC